MGWKYKLTKNVNTQVQLPQNCTEVLELYIPSLLILNFDPKIFIFATIVNLFQILVIDYLIISIGPEKNISYIIIPAYKCYKVVNSLTRAPKIYI